MLKLPVFIAWRYLKSKKSHNVINIISGISVAGVTIGTMALVVVLSVFNGFEGLVISLFNTFDPPVKVTATTGKTFSQNDYPLDRIAAIEGIKAQTGVLEDKALLRNGQAQYLATIKGVDSTFVQWTGLDSVITAGRLLLEDNNHQYAVAGQGVAYYLGLNPDDPLQRLEAYAPKRTGNFGIMPDQAFNRLDIPLAGIFSIQQDFDTKYVIVPLRFARELFGYSHELSSVEIALEPGADMLEAEARIQQALGQKFTVKNRFEQQETLYHIMRSEKWAIFLILSFILLIATFNVIGSLSMLILDKRKDIAILHSLGADDTLIRRIFLAEGMMVSFSGAIAGLILGSIICIVQQQFGLVHINAEGGSFLINTYPILMQGTDFLFVFLTVSCIGFAAAYIPVRSLGRIDTRSAAGYSG